MLWMVLGSALISALVQAMVRRQRRLDRRPPLDDPRWNAESRRQIAGRRCVECGGKVVFAGEGDACQLCGEIGHVQKCLAQHERSAHRVQTDIPYR